MTSRESASPPLERVVGLWGAVWMGLGSILGTGVFISLGIAAGVAGAGVVLAVALAAVVATANGLSSAQLAAAHPVSGGTYEYGHRLLHPFAGFLAGWMFLAAKSASAATAALGCASYLLRALSLEVGGWTRVAVAIGVVFVLTALVASGARRSNHVNIAIVTLTLVALGSLVALGWWSGRPSEGSGTRLRPIRSSCIWYQAPWRSPSSAERNHFSSRGILDVVERSIPPPRFATVALGCGLGGKSR